MDSGGSIPRCAAVWLVVTVSVAGLLACLAGDVVRAVSLISSGRLAAAPFDELLALLAALALVACGLWFWLVTTLITVEAALGGTAQTSRLARASCPEGLRRLLLSACGLALASGLVTPATAVEGQAPMPSPHPATLVGLPLPDRATVVAAPATLTVVATGGEERPHRTQAMRPRPGAYMSRTVRVRAGDTLWSLAASTLSPDASDADIATTCRAIYARNQRVIGGDPDLILPGTTLSLHHIQEESQ